MSDNVQALLNAAVRLREAGRFAEAIAAYRRVLAAHPGLADCWYNLGYLLRMEGRYEAALAAYEEALRRGIDRPEEVHLNRAAILADHLRRDDAAQQELQRALARNPGFRPALLNLGNLEEERGRREAAIAAYERLTEAGSPGGAPADECAGEALARLAHLRPPATTDDPLLARLEATAASATALPPETRANLYYALGRALDRLAAYEPAFAAFDRANEHARCTGRPYDARRTERECAALKCAFAARTPENRARKKDVGPAPIFICGMFRSGSTLIEQVLAGHERVTAGGELTILSRMIATTLAPFPAAVSRLDEARARALAADYRLQLMRLFPEASGAGCFVTDKRPDNFLRIGLVKRLFPAARIVHTVRQPLDNCLSVYFEFLDQNAAGYASDLRDIGRYYGAYRDLMAHWKSLYKDSIFDFDYDAFVREPEPSLRRLLDFLELDWDDRLLAFHRRENTVKTASYWQVRKPLYRQSSGRWRNYEPFLQPLRDALATAGVPEAGEGTA